MDFFDSVIDFIFSFKMVVMLCFCFGFALLEQLAETVREQDTYLAETVRKQDTYLNELGIATKEQGRDLNKKLLEIERLLIEVKKQSSVI